MERTDTASGSRVLFRLDGTFDAGEAWRVHDAIGQLGPEARVILDFRDVRAFHDFAVALLARDLLAMRGRVSATGLLQHQRRVLRYFGVDESALEEAGALTPPQPGAADPPG